MDTTGFGPPVAGKQISSGGIGGLSQQNHVRELMPRLVEFFIGSPKFRSKLNHHGGEPL